MSRKHSIPLWIRNANERINIWAGGNDLRLEERSSEEGINKLIKEFEAFPLSGGCGTGVSVYVARLTVSYSSITVFYNNKEISI